MGNMMAMNYEYLIRRAHQCGRYGTTGANADNYRGLERAYVLWRDANNGKNHYTKSIEELYAEYMKECGEISAYVRMAIDKVIRDFDGRMTEEQKIELEDSKSILNSRELDIDRIEEAIKRSEKTMLELGLYPQ